MEPSTTEQLWNYGLGGGIAFLVIGLLYKVIVHTLPHLTMAHKSEMANITKHFAESLERQQKTFEAVSRNQGEVFERSLERLTRMWTHSRGEGSQTREKDHAPNPED